MSHSKFKHVGDARGQLVSLVRHVKDARAVCLHSAVDSLDHVGAVARVEAVARLVENQQLWSSHQGPHDDYEPLLGEGQHAETAAHGFGNEFAQS